MFHDTDYADNSLIRKVVNYFTSSCGITLHHQRFENLIITDSGLSENEVLGKESGRDRKKLIR